MEPRIALPMVLLLAGCAAAPEPPSFPDIEVEPTAFDCDDAPNRHGIHYSTPVFRTLLEKSGSHSGLDERDLRDMLAQVVPLTRSYNATPYRSIAVTISPEGPADHLPHRNWSARVTGIMETIRLVDDYVIHLDNLTTDQWLARPTKSTQHAVPKDVFDAVAETVRAWNARESRIPEDRWLHYVAWGPYLGGCIQALLYARPPGLPITPEDAPTIVTLRLEDFQVVDVRVDDEQTSS